MKKLKIWSMIILAVMVLLMMFACGSDDEESPMQQVADNGFYSICQRAGILEDDYEWWGQYDTEEYLTVTGYKKGTDYVYSWYLDRATNELAQYSGSMGRTFNADLGYGEHAILEINTVNANVRREFDVDGNHVMKMTAYYEGTDAKGGTHFGVRQRIFLLKPDNTSVVLTYDEMQNTSDGSKVEKWYNNSIAVAGIPLDGTTVFSSQGQKIVTFPYSISCMTEEQRARIIEIYDYDKALEFVVAPYGDDNGRHDIIINFIDFTQSQSYQTMCSVRQAMLTSPVSSEDNRTKYSVEILQTDTSYCTVRMTLTEYSGNKKTFQFKIGKKDYTVEIV